MLLRLAHSSALSGKSWKSRDSQLRSFVQQRDSSKVPPSLAGDTSQSLFFALFPKVVVATEHNWKATTQTYIRRVKMKRSIWSKRKQNITAMVSHGKSHVVPLPFNHIYSGWTRSLPGEPRWRRVSLDRNMRLEGGPQTILQNKLLHLLVDSVAHAGIGHTSNAAGRDELA